MAWNVNTDLIKGNDMWLYIAVPTGDTPAPTTLSGITAQCKTIAYATSASLQVDTETIDVSSKLSCRWNAVVQGNASYTISADALYCLKSSATANSAYTVDHLFEAMVNGDNVAWIMAQDASDTCGTVAGPDLTKPFYWGEAAVTSFSIEAGNNEICSSSITLTGSGKINNE